MDVDVDVDVGGRGFNGATDFHRWKGRWNFGPLLSADASMGPPIFIGGKEEALGMTMIWGDDASMGPPIFIGGKGDSGVCNDNPCYRGLQWGHRFSSVESETVRTTLRMLMAASMGPPIFIGGKPRRPLRTSSMLRAASMGPPIFIGGKANSHRRNSERR